MTAVRQPSDVGDLAEFDIYLTPPVSNPSAVATEVKVVVKKPGQPDAAAVNAVEVGSNHWRYTAAARIDVAGRWVWRVNANAGLIGSKEIVADIADSALATPLP